MSFAPLATPLTLTSSTPSAKVALGKQMQAEKVAQALEPQSWLPRPRS